MVMSLGGKNIENRLWFLNRQPPTTSTQVQDLAAGVRDWHVSQVLPWLSRDLIAGAYSAVPWDSDPPPFIGVASVSTTGGINEASHSANVAIRVVFKGDTSQDFPNNSNFVPGIPIGQVEINSYSNFIRGKLFNAYVNLIDLAAIFGPFPAWRWVITSRQLNHAWRTEQVAARTDFIRFPSPYISPRRRRLPRP